MINDPETYRDAGRLAALAMNDSDYHRWKFHNEWMTRAAALETMEDAAKARQFYDAAYKRWRSRAIGRR